MNLHMSDRAVGSLFIAVICAVGTAAIMAGAGFGVIAIGVSYALSGSVGLLLSAWMLADKE